MEPLQTWWATELYPSKDEDTFGVAGDFEVVRATDAQAAIAALQARVKELEGRLNLNGQIDVGAWIADLQAQLTQRTAELEAAKRLATNAQWQIDYVLDEAKKAFDLKGHYTPSDLVDCALRPAASMLKERDELKAELERVRGELADERTAYKALSEQYNRLDLEHSDRRTLIAALPKVEGEITVNRVCTIMMHGMYCEEFTKLLQHRQGMEG